MHSKFKTPSWVPAFTCISSKAGLVKERPGLHQDGCYPSSHLTPVNRTTLKSALSCCSLNICFLEIQPTERASPNMPTFHFTPSPPPCSCLWKGNSFQGQKEVSEQCRCLERAHHPSCLADKKIKCLSKEWGQEFQAGDTPRAPGMWKTRAVHVSLQSKCPVQAELQIAHKKTWTDATRPLEFSGETR